MLGADAAKGAIELYNPWGFKKTITIAEFREAFSSCYEKKPTLPAHRIATTTTNSSTDGG